MRILVIDDNPLDRAIIAKLAKQYGCCDSVEDGLSGIDAFHRARAIRQAYDLIFLDVMMPKLDGISVLKTMREREDADTSHRAKIVMVTMLGDAESVVTAVRAGCDSYMVKPVSSSSFQEKIQALGVGGAV